MDRLTFEGDFCTIAMCKENPCPYDNSCTQREVWERLKVYEDTGLEPEEIEKAMAISALREQEKRRWIPATERLPRNYTPVLAYIPSLAQTKQQTVHECHIGADGEWHSATAPAYREAVTHWMPLPKPPKEV